MSSEMKSKRGPSGGGVVINPYFVIGEYRTKYSVLEAEYCFFAKSFHDATIQAREHGLFNDKLKRIELRQDGHSEVFYPKEKVDD